MTANCVLRVTELAGKKTPSVRPEHTVSAADRCCEDRSASVSRAEVYKRKYAGGQYF